MINPSSGCPSFLTTCAASASKASSPDASLIWALADSRLPIPPAARSVSMCSRLAAGSAERAFPDAVLSRADGAVPERGDALGGRTRIVGVGEHGRAEGAHEAHFIGR